jgi:hypothetical protein
MIAVFSVSGIFCDSLSISDYIAPDNKKSERIFYPRH